jgi:hypothetical protein
MTTFLLFFALMTVQYALVSINTRMVAQARYVGIAWSDAAICLLSFTLIRSVGADDTVTAQAGYCAGGVVGGVLGTWLSRGEKKA